MALSTGTRLGPYEVVSQIGSGGMGEVYKARDTRLDRLVAIKVVRADLAADPQFRARFDREARAISALEHPNICSLYDVGEQGGAAFLVMQYLEGETLQARLAKGALPAEHAIQTAIEIASALDKAHRSGFVHRDLKPANVMLTQTGARLLDFGLAKAEEPPDSNAATRVSNPGLTSPGMIVGTVQYMSPEQIEGKATDPRTDLFAFGAVLYEMICGRKAFAGDSQFNVMAAILERDPAAASALSARPALERLVRTCLAKRKDERPASAAEVVRQLQSIADAAPAPAVPRQPAAMLDSLAVLPFVNASHDPGAAYLVDGITESLINALSQLPNLRVIPRTTAFQYRDHHTNPIAVGRALDVRAVLTGKVLQRDDMLAVQAELLDVPNESQVWGAQYSRKLADVFAVQEEIAQEIVAKLRIRLTPEDRRRLMHRPTGTSEVYQLYLKGRFHWAKRSADGIQKGMEYFQRAIEADPNYALAYTGLADGYILLNYFGMPSSQAAPRAKSAAAEAVAIDGTLAEAHTSLAFSTYLHDWDFPRAERSFKRALDVNPEYWEAHDWYSLSLAGVGLYEEAVAEMDRALHIDPLSLVLHHHAAWVSMLARDFDRVIDLSRTAVEMEPRYGLSHLWMGRAYTHKHLHDEAIAALETAVPLLPENVVGGALVHAYAAAGRMAQAEAYLRHIHGLASQHYLEPYNMATAFVGLGDVDGALMWLERAYDERSIWLASFAVGDPTWDSIRGHSRFERVVRPFTSGR